MTRTARIISDSKLYHIVIRGNNRQILFEENEDYDSFLRMIRNCIKKYEVTVIAYVLMSNHVHLIIKDNNDNMSSFMKSVELRYARYFNKKYERVGALFQGRFFNIPIMNEIQLHNTVAYIIRNPERAGISDFRSYKWSSFHEYKSGQTLVTDTYYFNKIMDNIFEYIDTVSVCKEKEKYKISDSEAKKIIRKLTGEESGTVIQKYDKAKRDSVIRELKNRRMSIRQIERLTGIGKGIIQRA